MGPIYQHSKTPNRWYSSQGMLKFNDFSLAFSRNQFYQLVDVCPLPIAWSVEIFFHAFHGLFFQESKTFWRFPSFQNDYTIQKKPPPTTQRTHCDGAQDSDLRKLKHASLLPKAIWSPRVMDSFADVILFGPVYFVFLCLLTAFCKKKPSKNHKFMVFVVLFPRLQIDSIEIFGKETGRPTT